MRISIMTLDLLASFGDKDAKQVRHEYDRLSNLSKTQDGSRAVVRSIRGRLRAVLTWE